MKRAAITRRTALRGLGVSLVFPFLESLPGYSQSAREKPWRLAFVYAPNGKHLADWQPSSEGKGWELPPTLQPLQHVRDQVSILSGLSHKTAEAGMDGPGDHARAMATFLTGARPRKTSGSEIRVGPSIDQVAAGVLGQTTKIPSLEVGCEGGKPAGACDNGYSCAYQTNLSWRSASTPMPKEIDPRLVFERLFGSPAKASGDAERARRERDRKSLLDFVAEDARELGKELAASDRRKLDEYLTSVREVEQRIQRVQPVVAFGKDKLARPSGIPEDYREHSRLLSEMLALAFSADITRVATFVLGNDGSNRSYREIDISDGHHDLSHHGGDGGKINKLRLINRLHVSQFAHLLETLKAKSEGQDSLLNRCIIVYGSGISDGDRHNHDNLPILIAGGDLGGGRHLKFSTGTPLCNLYLNLLDRVGIQMERFGDSTGRLMGL